MAVSTILAKLVGPAVEFDDAKSGAAEMVNVKDQPDLLYVVVLKQDGSTFFRYRDSAGVDASAELLGLVTQEQVVERDSTLHVSIPVRGKEHGLLGTMVAGFSRQSIVAARRAERAHRAGGQRRASSWWVWAWPGSSAWGSPSRCWTPVPPPGGAVAGAGGRRPRPGVGGR